ncbi:hypothetical protein K492DRAFT_161387 [Lichtheimia hyalospora FSU 10163]|nr:hypothetical protein K492DRAFT_161387 [Lichtheimia hyalospora FSU 10163]
MCKEDNSQWLQDEALNQLYSEYVGIRDRKQLATHWETIRARLNEDGKAYKCIEQFKFLSSRLATRFYYPRILELGKEEPTRTFIDIGCCTDPDIGTDLRQLLLDGYPGTCLIGTDLSKHYIECGYDLFQDRDTCPIHFTTGDIFDSKSPSLARFQNKIGIAYSGSVIHLLQSIDQVDTFITQVTRLLAPGGLFVGTHVAADRTISVYIPPRHYTKHWVGVHDFKAALQRHHFGDIEIKLEPRLTREEEKPYLDVQCHWLSFSAVYYPPSSHQPVE